MLESEIEKYRFPSNRLFMSNKVEVARQIGKWVSKGWNIDNRDEMGLTSLMWAAHGGALEMLRALMASGCNVDAVSEKIGKPRNDDLQWYGLTAAMYAAKSGKTRCLAALIAAGCDISVRDSQGHSALSFAESRGEAECVVMIQSAMERGALSREIEDGDFKKPGIRM